MENHYWFPFLYLFFLPAGFVFISHITRLTMCIPLSWIVMFTGRWNVRHRRNKFDNPNWPCCRVYSAEQIQVVYFEIFCLVCFCSWRHQLVTVKRKRSFSDFKDFLHFRTIRTKKNCTKCSLLHVLQSLELCHTELASWPVTSKIQSVSSSY